jgi:predicted DNA-binding helix-hairpin-helix protein
MFPLYVHGGIKDIWFICKTYCNSGRCISLGMIWIAYMTVNCLENYAVLREDTMVASDVFNNWVEFLIIDMFLASWPYDRCVQSYSTPR